MIDFRYHVVSLVSVFVALAVGIAIGAGPLSGPITDATATEVDHLRADNQSKQEQIASLTKSLREHDDFVTRLSPNLVAQQLAGRAVAVVTLPGADGDTVKGLLANLVAAGATVTARVEVKDGWSAGDNAPGRQRLLAGTARSGAPSATGTPPGNGIRAFGSPSPTVAEDPARALDDLLARSLLTTDPTATGQPDATAEAELNAFSHEGLISLPADFTGRATQAVVVAPSVAQVTVNAATPAASASAADLAPDWAVLSARLDAAGDGAVVLGPASSAAAGGVVAAVRADGELAKRVSTVDTGGTPLGYVAAVFALREQLAGAAGAYGYAGGATAPLPTAVLAP